MHNCQGANARASVQVFSTAFLGSRRSSRGCGSLLPTIVVLLLLVANLLGSLPESAADARENISGRGGRAAPQALRRNHSAWRRPGRSTAESTRQLSEAVPKEQRDLQHLRV